MAVIPFALGVDFGTSTTVAVLRWPDGRPKSLLFDGSPLLPSAVFAEDHAILTGRDALMAARSRPERLEAHPKRLIDAGTVLLGGRQVPVADLIMAVLDRVWAEANRVASGPIASVALTHPAAWGPRRREVLWQGAARLGMPTPALVPEPVAAAAYFVHELRRDVPVGRHLVVYDLGAGTFDASVVRRTEEGFDVLATTGLPDTGGLDIDAAVVGYLGATVSATRPEVWERLERPSTTADRRASLMLWEDVKAAKEILSRISSAMVHIPIVEDSVPIGREQLERLARPMLDRTVAATVDVLRESGVDNRAIAGVFLVGGASRVPLIGTLLHRSLGFAPVAVEQPELVVAEGSAMMSATAPPPSAVPIPQPVPAPAPPPVPVPIPVPVPDWRSQGQWPIQPAPARPPRRAGRILLLVTPAVLLVGALVALLIVRPWKSTAGGDPTRTTPATTSPTAEVTFKPLIGTKVESALPAAIPTGARRGGSLTVAIDFQIESLDPQIAFTTAEITASRLVHRGLTGFREDGKQPQLVGDLADSPGTDVSTGVRCTAWEFTLRPNLTYEDGSPITAADVANGVARSFQDLPGTTYIQEWLTGGAYKSTYTGPETGPALPPGVTTPATNKIRFTFPKPHCDFPLAASAAVTTPVPRAKDTGPAYAKKPLASGPYKVASFTDSQVRLVRNTRWEAAGDPLRAALPDEVIFAVQDPTVFTQSVIGEVPSSESAVALFQTPKDLTGRLPDTRVATGYSTFTWYLHINTARVTDPAVRKAINYAVDKKAIIDLVGGESAARIATTIIPPSLPGHRDFDAYPAPPEGNPEEARKVLGGKPFPLVLAVQDVPDRVARAQSLKASLDRVGFAVTIQKIERAKFFTEVYKKDAPYDLVHSAFVTDWLGTGTFLSSMFGATAVELNGVSLTRLSAGDVISEIDNAAARPVDEAMSEWGRIDEKIMREYAPVVPIYVAYLHHTYGTKVGGVFISPVTNAPSLDRVYLR